ncbi:alpha/beta fold hydrolase [Acerihabitans sp. KWT182]|uniref:Alpha/beta fold hydrolase n=1 Tax=Acerihabitans sp. KWT182 TaxID=3157919 RepID=A0AAU7Q653_9GAMM
MKWAVHRLRPGKAGRPWLIWLHGLLGSGADWAPVLPYFDGWPQAALDLPGHGASCAIAPESFAAVSQGLAHTLASLGIEHYILIGYSLGGRIALYHACRNSPAGLRGLFVEGAHPGVGQPAGPGRAFAPRRRLGPAFRPTALEAGIDRLVSTTGVQRFVHPAAPGAGGVAHP